MNGISPENYRFSSPQSSTRLCRQLDAVKLKLEFFCRWLFEQEHIRVFGNWTSKDNKAWKWIWWGVDSSAQREGTKIPTTWLKWRNYVQNSSNKISGTHFYHSSSVVVDIFLVSLSWHSYCYSTLMPSSLQSRNQNQTHNNNKRVWMNGSRNTEFVHKSTFKCEHLLCRNIKREEGSSKNKNCGASES